jgi:hypothetical protein
VSPPHSVTPVEKMGDEKGRLSGEDLSRGFSRFLGAGGGVLLTASKGLEVTF